MKIKSIMIHILIGALLVGTTAPSFARTDGGSKGSSGNGLPNKATQKYNNPSGRENCYYCWKDLSIDYTPSRHKYAKKS